MTRKKVKLAYIINDSARKATFKKRKKGLMKKVSELSTLCGIDACAIIYSPYESQPDLWPNAMGVQRIVAQFKRMPEMEQTKKMMNQESYTRQRITKVNELLKKQQKDNREMEITELMYQCLTGTGLQNLGIRDLHDLGWILDHKLKEINNRCESLKKAAREPQVVTQPPPTPQTQTHNMMHMGSNNQMSPPNSPTPPQEQTQTYDMMRIEVLNHRMPPPHPPTLQTQSHMMYMGGSNYGMMTREVMKGPLSHNLGLDLGMGLNMDTMQRPHHHRWLSEWINNPNDHMGFGQNNGGNGHGGGEMMMPFNNNNNNPNPNPNCLGGFFP